MLSKGYNLQRGSISSTLASFTLSWSGPSFHSVPGIIRGAEDRAADKTDGNPQPRDADILVGKTGNKHIGK